MGSLAIGFELNRRHYLLRGQMERSKAPDLVALIGVLSGEGVPYAIIGGVALQVHQSEPRTTLDIDVAVPARSRLPGDALRAGGFQETGRYEHSDYWVGPGGTPVQFTEDPVLLPALDRAIEIEVEGARAKVLAVADLLHETLRAGQDPRSRRSKRLQDLTNAQSLLESHPELDASLTEQERAVLASLPG